MLMLTVTLLFLGSLNLVSLFKFLYPHLLIVLALIRGRRC